MIIECDDKLEYNTPVRNLVRGVAYGMHNEDQKQDYQIMSITGSDYASFYQGNGKWLEKTYLLFRNYSIYYFKKEFEECEKRNIHKHQTRVYKKD